MKPSQARISETAIKTYAVRKDHYALTSLDDADAIEAVQEEWRKLELTCREPFAAFQSTHWCMAWLRSARIGDEKHEGRPRVFVLRKNGQAVLVWPTLIVISRIGARLLTDLTDPLGQYCNVIVDRKAVPQDLALEALGDAVKHVNVDAVTLKGIPQGSLLHTFTQQSGIVETATEATVLDITRHENWDAYVTALPKRMRKRRNQRHNRLKRLGKLTYQVHCGGTLQFRQLVDRALDMKGEWLQETGRRASIIASSRTRGFLQELRGEQNKQGTYTGAVAHGLYLDDVPIAIEIGLVQAQHYYVYLGAFDWALRDYSPGKVQMKMSQKWAFDFGIEFYDFLGEPAEYKASWTDSAYPIHSRAIPLTKFGHAYCKIWKAVLRPLIKSNFERLNPRYKKAVMATASRISGESDRGDTREPGDCSVRKKRTA